MAEDENDAKFLEFVVKELVDVPEDVKVNRTVDEMGVLLTLDVNAADMGKIIGRQGNTAKAIQDVASPKQLIINRINQTLRDWPYSRLSWFAEQIESLEVSPRPVDEKLPHIPPNRA